MVELHDAVALASGPTLTLADALVLVSWWKALLLLIPFVPWAWFVSKILDKHASRFVLPREQWNSAHLFVGLAAIVVALSIPLQSEASFWIGWALMLLMLAADIFIFAMVTNKDERVPEAHRLTFDLSKYREAKQAKAAAKLQGKAEFVIKAPDKSVIAPPQVTTPEFQLRVNAESIVAKAFAARASQIDLSPVTKEGLYGAVVMVDGVRQALELSPADPKAGTPAVTTMPAQEGVKLIDFWRSCAKLDLNERRKRQQADIVIERGTTRNILRLSSIGGQTGQRLTLLIDPEKAVRRKLENLGLLEPQLAELKRLAETPGGIVILSSPLDAGRTTTFYSCIKLHDAYTRNIQTVETDVQDSPEGVRQNRFDPQGEGAEFSTTVRSMIRRDPDVLGVAEIPDANTVKEICRADPERVRIYASMQADSALQALQSWIKLAGDADTATRSLRAVMGQRLVRRLCNNCRIAYQPSPDMVKRLGLPPDKIRQLFKKGGQVLIKNKPEICPVCGGQGYSGQEGIFELIPIGDVERMAIKNGDLAAIRVELRKRGLPSLQQAAIKKAIDGVTSVEEIMRVTAEGAPAPKPPSPAAPAAST